MFKKLLSNVFLCFSIFSFSALAEMDIDQWEDSDKTYAELINNGFEVKGYDTSHIQIKNGYLLMFFVTVLQKKEQVYECQEYQTLDDTMETLDMSLVCRKLVQPYQHGVGT